MWKTLSDWLLALFSMGRELQEHRAAIRQLEARQRDLEEAVNLLAQEQRHGREIESAERQNLLMRVQDDTLASQQSTDPRQTQQPLANRKRRNDRRFFR